LLPDNGSVPLKPFVFQPLVFLALLGGIIFTVRSFQFDQYLEKERLRQIVAGYGILGPVSYILSWVAAALLCLPGFPIGLAGAILFGRFWGVIYTISGATIGVPLAFPFPYNLLNYAFGLNRISLQAYVASTFIFMLPMTVAIIYFSANLLALLRGKITWGMVVGIILVALV